ncbi:MAG: Transcriptional regulator, AcrR family, partial [uncultured Rubrobacteraceae bacterium]
ATEGGREKTRDQEEAGGGAALGGGVGTLLPGGHRGRRRGHRLREGQRLQEDALQPLRGQRRPRGRVPASARREVEGVPARRDRGGGRAQGEAPGGFRGLRGMAGGRRFSGLPVRQRRGRDTRPRPSGPSRGSAAQGRRQGTSDGPGRRRGIRRASGAGGEVADLARGRHRDRGDAPQRRAPRSGEIRGAGATGRPISL